jgi:hypothetical protein
MSDGPFWAAGDTVLATIKEKLYERHGSLLPFTGSKPRVLVLTHPLDIAITQILPLARAPEVEVRTMPLAAFLAGRNRYEDADAVCVQTHFSLTDEQMQEVMLRIRRGWPGRPIAYFDWFAPTDLRFAQVLDPHILAYVKKQIRADFSRYAQPTLGDTLLTDFYARRFGLALPERRFPLPPDFERKIVLGSGFECSPNTRQFLRASIGGTREIDLHARFATEGTEWYARMRQECQQKALELEGKFRVACRGQVPRRAFRKELWASKMCFSPFGYGAVCWRDFEAMASGALLLKPDMSHIRLARPFFVPNETYVALSWDLSDLEEKVSYYATHHQEREAITHNAQSMLSKCTDGGWFVEDIAPLWRLLGLSPKAAAVPTSARRAAT